MAVNDITRISINAQTKLNYGFPAESVREWAWSKWYETKRPEDVKRWIKPALEADDSVKETLSKMELTRKEHDLLKDVGTLHQFLALTVRLEQDHRKKKGTGNFQQSIANFQTFAKSYSNVVEALVSAGPFGAGHLVWGICSIAVTAVANKYQKEQTIYKSITKISKSLPRLDAYRELYPTPRMIQLLAQLYATNLEFLCEVFAYYKCLTWKGSVARFFSSNTLSNNMEPLASDIDGISREIIDEGMVGFSAELRTTRLLTEEVQHKLKESSDEISDLRSRFYDSEEHECRKDVSRIKHIFVPSSYDPKDIYSVASSQIRALGRDTVQVQSCQSLLYQPPFAEWRTWSTARPDTKAPQPKKIIWLTSSERDDLTISHVAHDIIELLERASDGDKGKVQPTVLHSLYQTKLQCSNAADHQRTASTIINEAIYQLLHRHPRLVRSNETLKTLCRIEEAEEMSLQDLGSILRSLLECSTSFSPGGMTGVRTERSNGISRTQPPVFWIIDRVDECRFKGGKGASKLRKFVRLLEEIVEHRGGMLRVLMTSLYAPHLLDVGWEDDVEEDGRSDDWIECYYPGQ